MKRARTVFFAVLLAVAATRGAAALTEDIIPTSGGPLKIGLVGHGSVYFEYNGKVIQVDPWSKVGDYSTLPKADLVLITHEHRDHLDPEAVAQTSKTGAVVVANAAAGAKIPGARVLANGDTATVQGFAIQAVPAYNIVSHRPEGAPYHPKGEGNGYVITFGDKRIYVAGDTEDIPEMTALAGVDVAFLPMNLPFTMSPEMAVHAAKMVSPRILYPYHTTDTDMDKLGVLLKEFPGVDVRIYPMR